MFFYSLFMLLMVNLTSFAAERFDIRQLKTEHYSPKINNVSLYKVVKKNESVEVFLGKANKEGLIATIKRQNFSNIYVCWHPEGTHLLVIQKNKAQIIDLSIVDLLGKEVSKVPCKIPQEASIIDLSESGYRLFVGTADSQDDDERPGKVLDWNGKELAVATYSDWLEMLGRDEYDSEDEED